MYKLAIFSWILFSFILFFVGIALDSENKIYVGIQWIIIQDVLYIKFWNVIILVRCLSCYNKGLVKAFLRCVASFIFGFLQSGYDQEAILHETVVLNIIHNGILKYPTISFGYLLLVFQKLSKKQNTWETKGKGLTKQGRITMDQFSTPLNYTSHGT